MAGKKRLFNLKAREVSFVPRGANKRKLLVTKEDSTMDEILKELLEFKFENEAELDEKIAKMLPEDVSKEDLAKAQGTMKAALKLLKGLGKQLPEGGKDLMKNIQDLLGNKKPEDKKVSKEDPKPNPAPKSKTEDVAMTPDELKEHVSKQLEDVTNANEVIVKELQDSNKQLAKDLAHEKDIRVEKEFVGRAKALGYHGDKAEEMGKVLKTAKDHMDEKQFEALEKELKSKNDNLKAGNIFGQIGSDQGGVSKSDDKLDAAAEEIRKADSDLTKEQAIAKALDENPDLYNEYLDEHPAQGGR